MAFKPLLVLAGGSGYLGRLLRKQLGQEYRFLILGRAAALETESGEDYLQWPASPALLSEHLEGCLAVINLAGRSVDCRYTATNKKAILESRIRTTCFLGESIALCKRPPQVWINSSSATVYPDSETAQTELSPTPGDTFSERVCLEWEAEAERFLLPETRKIILRTGLVMGHDGGAFPVLKRLARLGLGGSYGNGDQYMSILHKTDFVRAVDFLVRNRCFSTYNLCIPQPIRNRDFMTHMRMEIPTATGLSLNKPILELGARILRSETELMLKSRCVIPQRLLNEGFQFRYENGPAVLKALLPHYFQSEVKSSRSCSTGNFSRPSCKAL